MLHIWGEDMGGLEAYLGPLYLAGGGPANHLPVVKSLGPLNRPQGANPSSASFGGLQPGGLTGC